MITGKKLDRKCAFGRSITNAEISMKIKISITLKRI